VILTLSAGLLRSTHLTFPLKFGSRSLLKARSLSNQVGFSREMHRRLANGT
jgi:hypothetical protein